MRKARLKKNELRDRLRAIGCYNVHEFLQRFGEPGKTDIACTYTSPDPRSVWARRTRVYSPSHKTDPSAHWHDNGCKSFTGARGETMPQAVAWAGAKYGITEWVPFCGDAGERVPKVVLDRAMAYLEEVGKNA